MRSKIRLVAVVLSLPLAACASAGGGQRPGIPSAVELRALQTRSYEATSSKAVMHALLDTMQDEGFRISRTEPELGLIVAEKEHVSQPGTAKKVLRGYLIVATYGAAALLPWQGFRRSVLEATAQVSEAEGGVKVRVGLQLRVLDKDGRVVRAQTIEDGAAYQALFARLDKSLYLRKEGL